ncbi:acyl-CoA-binding protein [Entophlyctis helioformis]|nr:acyl-CoA-binding protein [Entophlyctis helioformis]
MAASKGATMDAKFQRALAMVSASPAEVSPPAYWPVIAQDKQLYLYARFKQVTIGPCQNGPPWWADHKGRFKWEAWRGLGTMSADVARAEYVALVADLLWQFAQLSKEQIDAYVQGNLSGNDRIKAIQFFETCQARSRCCKPRRWTRKSPLSTWARARALLLLPRQHSALWRSRASRRAGPAASRQRHPADQQQPGQEGRRLPSPTTSTHCCRRLCPHRPRRRLTWQGHLD